MAWNNAVVTNNGVSMLQQVLAGQTLTIDNAGGGSGTVLPATLMAQTALVSKKQIFAVVGATNVTNGKKLNILITNVGLTTGYTMQQVGIWAHVGTGPSTLFAILQDETGITISSETDLPDFALNFYAVIDFSNESSFALTVDTSALVSVGMMNASKDEAISAAAADATAKADTAERNANDYTNNAIEAIPPVDLSGKLDKSGDGSNVTAAFTQAATRTNVATGEKMSVLFGKIRKWFADLGTAAFKNTGVANGVAELGADGKVPAGQLPTIASAAADITYDNIASGLVADDVQAAIDETLTKIYTPEIVVTVDSGSMVTCTDGTTTLTGTSTGTCTFRIPNFGTWTVTATLGNDTDSTVVEVVETRQYSITLQYVAIYGIEWNYGSTSTACTRLEASAAFADPTPAVGTGSGSSPFDNLYPWNEMAEFNVASNAITYAKDEAGFSRTNDTVIRIPKFYIKVEKDTANSKLRIYIADKETTGFVIHPAFNRGDGVIRDYIYVGKYNAGSGYVSKTGVAPLASITRGTFRTSAAAKGANWWQYDYATYSALWMLYMIEFADWDSQSKIGRGYVDGNSSPQNVGTTDAMTYHTGRPSGTDGKTSVQYRGIEDLWGNVYDFVDGMNFNGLSPYVCLNPTNFADDTSSNYTKLGYNLGGTSGEFIKELGYDGNNPAVLLPIATGGSETTHIPDRVYHNSTASWYIFCVGGNYSAASAAGLFCSHCGFASSLSSAGVGGRLLFLP